MIDTHSHIYSEEFSEDKQEVIQRAKEAGVRHIIMPNVDGESLPLLLETEKTFPDYCHAAIGLHPTSVNENYHSELEIIERELERRQWIGVGEIGIDLYWDKTYIREQIIVFRQQIEWAIKYNLPVIIHVRDSFDETMQVLSEFKSSPLKGIFHSFAGNLEQANEMLEFNGFMLGINGIITFKNSGLANVVRNLPLNRLVLETDAPYLTPAPFRGKRNESAYLSLVVNKFSEVFQLSTDEIITQTIENTLKIFNKLGATK